MNRRKKISAVLALAGLTGWTATAAITVQAWYHLNAGGLPTDASGHGHDFVNTMPAPAQPEADAPAGLLGGSGYVSAGSLRFGSNGTSGFYETGYPTPEDNYGIEVWVKPAPGNGNGWILATGGSLGNPVLLVNDGRYAVMLVGGAWVNRGEVAAHPGQWTHLAFVMADGLARFYVNGVAQRNDATGIGVAAGNAMHLGVTSGGGSGFHGLIGEARVFTFAPGAFTTNDLLLASGQVPAQAPPFLITEPRDQSADAGDLAVFHACAGGPAPLAWQWYFGTHPLADTTNDTLAEYNVSARQAGNYFAVITNAYGSVTSRVATLTVSSLLTLAPATGPDAGQQAMIDRKYGMFCHFGINTFLDMEWSDGTYSPTNYVPAKVDADQWVRTARLAGMRYLLCITKHHDGFCLWPSAYTTYSVKYSGNTNDVVRLVADACAKYGVKLALYYSLWDRHEPSFTTNFDPGYISYMTNQLTELMSNYGPVCELWLDGDWTKPNTAWRLPVIYDLVKRLQPGCQISANLTVGNPTNVDGALNVNEQRNGFPLRYFPSDFRLFDGQLPAFPDPKLFSKTTAPGNTYYLPFESTLTLSGAGHWFFNTTDTNPPKAVGRLEKWWDGATAQDNLLVLNAAPNRDGVLPLSNSNVLMQLAYRLGLEPGQPFPVNLAAGRPATASSVWQNDAAHYGPALVVDADPESRWSAAAGTTNGWLEINLGGPVTFSRVILNEHQSHIRAFRLEVEDDAGWHTITSGTTIGESLRLDFAPVTGSKLRLDILDATGVPSLWNLKVQGPADLAHQ